MDDDLEAELATVDVSGVQGTLDDVDLDDTLDFAPSSTASRPRTSTPAKALPVTSTIPGVASSVPARALSPPVVSATTVLQQQHAHSADSPTQTQPAEQASSWWGNIWTAAATTAASAASITVSAASAITAPNTELNINRALDTARKTIESGSERIRERVADVARTTASRTLEKILDAIDPIDDSSAPRQLFSFDEWVRFKDDSRVKIIICTLDPTFFSAASIAFERLHGDGSIYIRGLALESAPAVDIADSMTAAVHSAAQRLDEVLALPESQRPPDEFLLITMTPFIFDVAPQQPFFGVVAMLHDVRAQIRVSCFSPVVPISRELSPAHTTSYDWVATQLDGQLSVPEMLDAAMRGLLGSYWFQQRKAGMGVDESEVKA